MSRCIPTAIGIVTTVMIVTRWTTTVAFVGVCACLSVTVLPASAEWLDLECA